jgi:NAD(P)-dependent dehydrogenase (short-subunit alcohol dehydrogenase family)
MTMFLPEHKTALVTGGSDGIGKEIALGLARKGIQVLIVGRDRMKGHAAAAELQRSADHLHINFFSADLGSPDGIERLTAFVAERWSSLHYLVHCAGIVRGRRELTADGVESNFAVNYLSRFRLTLALLPLLRAAARPDAAARILIIGGAALVGKVDFEDVNLTDSFSTARAVLQCQCANDIFTLELNRRLQTGSGQSSPVNVNIVKYGVVKTNIRTDMPMWLRAFAAILDPLIGQTARKAAEPALSVLLDPEFQNVTGAMFLDIRRFVRIVPRRYVADPLQGRRLWEISEKLSGIQHVGEASCA